MTDDFRTRLDRLWASREERDSRLSEILKSEDDLISIVLRGHLVVEELLYSAVAAHCVTPDYLSKANLRFRQLMALLRALEKLPTFSDWMWRSLSELNSLRNALAHQLESVDLNARVDRFVATIPRGQEGEARVPPPANQKEAVRYALHYLLGAMSMVSYFQGTMEELVLETITKQNAQEQTPANAQSKKGN